MNRLLRFANLFNRFIENNQFVHESDTAKVRSYALECSEVKVKVTQNKTTPVKYRYLKNVEV